jgi:hypothetical protein
MLRQQRLDVAVKIDSLGAAGCRQPERLENDGHDNGE